MKKILLLIVSVLLFISSCSRKDEVIEKNEGQSNELTVSGNLSDYISEENRFKITKLTINGVISGKDWDILFEMAVLGNLEILDMSNAQIKGVEGADYWNDNEIPEYNFSGSEKLKEVFLPKNIKVIGTEAFSKCTKLTTVHFPDQIDSIATRAFYDSGLSGEFNVPKQLRVVGKQAFGKTKFNKVIIHSDVFAAKASEMYTLYGNSVFANCAELTEVVVKEGCTMLELGFSHCTSLVTVSLPKSLKKIGYLSDSTANYIFDECSKLETITLPENLTYIGSNAFSSTSLKSIKIPDKVQYLDGYVFEGCELLEEVVLPISLIHIGSACFEGCKMLDNITIPSKVSEIAYSAFGNCALLQSVSFEGDVFSIGEEAFSGCTSLETIILPDGLESLGSSAFEGCSSLSKVIISDKLERIEATTFKDCVELQEVILGESMETLGSSCFFRCPKLTKLIIPITVKKIENYAFSYTGLKDLTVMWTSPIAINNNVFDGINLSRSLLKVPLGTKDLYKTSLGWKNFGTIEEFKDHL